MPFIKDILSGSRYSKKELLLYFAVIWSVVRFSFTYAGHNFWHIGEFASSIAYFIDPIITILIMGSFIYSISLFKIFKHIHVFFIIILMVFVVSLTVNMELIKINNAFKFFIGYYKFIFLFLFASLLYENHDKIVIRMVKLILILLVFQIFVHFTWMLKLQIFANPNILISGNKDWAYGTMENTHILALSFIVLFSYSIFKLFQVPKGKWKYIILLALSALQIVLAESKVNFVLISLSLIISLYFILDKKKFLMSTAIVSVIFLAFISVSIIIYSSSSHFQTGDLFQVIEGLTHIITHSFNYNYKLIFIDNLLNQIPSEQFLWLFGSGPGVLGSKFALENPTYMSAKYFVPLVEGNFNFGNSVLTSVRTGFTAIYADLGPIGFLTYFGLHIHIIRVISRSLKKNRKEHSQMNMIKFIWLGLMLNHLFNQLFIDSLYVGAPVLIIWTMGALLYYDSLLNSTTKDSV